MRAGGGLGAYAVGMRRMANPVIKKYIVTATKQVAKKLFEAALPELGQVLSGKKRTSCEMLKSVVKNTAEQTHAKKSKMLNAAT